MDFDIQLSLARDEAPIIASTLAFPMTRRKVRLHLIRGVRLNLADAAERRTLLLVEAWICRPRQAMRLQSPAERSIGPIRTTCDTT